jgi:serine protease
MRNRRLLVLMTGLVFLLCAGLAFSADFKVKQRSGEQLQSEYANNEILVKFKPTAKNIPSIHATLGIMEIPVSMNADFQRLRIPATATVEEMLAAYRANPDVEYAEPNYIYHAFLVPNDPYYSYQWHMPSINVGPAWDLSTGAGVLVGIIDTGVGYENYGVYGLAPDLAGATFVAGYDFVNNDAHANDDNAHGTHVTGTVRQSTNNGLGTVGVAFNCSIMPIKVLDASGNGYVSDIAEGITYAADHGCKVINMSLGGPSGSSALQTAVQYAYNAGVTIVCAAGNAGTSTPQYPAAYTECISVSSVRYDNTKPSYSSYGSTIDICAPGGDIGVDQNGDGYGDGVLQQTFEAPNYTTWGYWFYDGGRDGHCQGRRIADPRAGPQLPAEHGYRSWHLRLGSVLRLRQGQRLRGRSGRRRRRECAGRRVRRDADLGNRTSDGAVHGPVDEQPHELGLDVR